MYVQIKLSSCKYFIVVGKVYKNFRPRVHMLYYLGHTQFAHVEEIEVMSWWPFLQTYNEKVQTATVASSSEILLTVEKWDKTVDCF